MISYFFFSILILLLFKFLSIDKILMSKLFDLISKSIHKFFIQFCICNFLQFKNRIINKFITLILILMVEHSRHISHKCLGIANMISPINYKLLKFTNYFILLFLLYYLVCIWVIHSIKVILKNIILRCSKWHCIRNNFTKCKIKTANLPRFFTAKKIAWII